MEGRLFKTATGELIEHFKEIERLLTAVYCPKEVAVMDCKGHNRDGSKIAENIQLAGCQARKVALTDPPSLQLALIWTGTIEQENHNILRKNQKDVRKRGAKITDKGWLQSEDRQLIIPENAQWKILKVLEQSFHCDIESTYQMASLYEGKKCKENFKKHYQEM